MSSRAPLLIGLYLVLCSAWLGTPAPALARVERFAVIVGNNHGLPSEARLRYAEADAKRMYDVLRELGGFEPMNMVLLAGASADEMRRTLITVNDRVRGALALPSSETELFVFYSGHADAEALHLGTTRLPIAEVSQLVRGSAATFRMLVLDACQSGSATRVKGGRITSPFDTGPDLGLGGQGLALLTASTANEDAQESDELGGSFFTHALVSGMLGAADQDLDGNVVLEEAYRYAYDTTLRSTSRTAHGVQHPTFSYDLKGHGDVVLTRPGLRSANRGKLSLPAGAAYLVLRGGPDGPVLAEINREDSARTLSLLAGRYFVRGRTGEYLMEGHVELGAGASIAVAAAQLERIEYAHLVRKGGPAPAVHALELGARARSTLPNAQTPCLGGYAGYRLDLERIAISLRAGACTSTFENDVLSARVDEYDLSMRAGYVWDVAARTSVELGAGAGPSAFFQRFETRDEAPPRRTFAGHAELYGDLSVELGRGVYLTGQVAGQMYVLPLAEGRSDRGQLRAAFAGRAAVGVGKRF